MQMYYMLLFQFGWVATAKRHEQPAKTQISLYIAIVCQILLSAWDNVQADLSLVDLQAILLVGIFMSWLRFMEMIIVIMMVTIMTR